MAEQICEMIERAAKAMFERRPAYMDSAGNRRWTWERADEESKAYWRDLACAVIETMRKPTSEMLLAGNLAWAENKYACECTNIWWPMIEAALK